MLLSEKQRSFLAHSDSFITVADGAVRSGKTHASMIRLAELCAKGPPGDFAVFGKTERTVKRNVVYPLQEGLPAGAVRYVQGAGELYVFGRRCWVVGANDARSEEKVRGMTLAGAYANEVTLYPHELWQQLIDRCSVDGAQILADCNPDSPYHWLHADYLTAGLPKKDLKRFRFKLDDNPVLNPEYKARLSRLHAPGSLWHRRMVEGEWVVAEGAVYEQWDDEVHVVDEIPKIPERVVIGVDYGTQNATVFLAVGKVGRTWYVFDEYYHSGRETNRQKTDAEYSSEMRRFIERVGTPTAVVVDPSAASFKAQLSRDGVRKVRDADNAVLDGVREVSTALSDGTLKVLSRCERLRREFPNYVWDPKKQKQGVDEPMKSNDIHSLDALRYLVMHTRQRRSALRVVR